MPVPADVRVPELYAVSNIGIVFMPEQSVQRFWSSVRGFYLNGDKTFGVAEEKVHFHGGVVVAVEIKQIPLLHEHLGDNVLEQRDRRSGFFLFISHFF